MLQEDGWQGEEGLWLEGERYLRRIHQRRPKKDLHPRQGPKALLLAGNACLLPCFGVVMPPAKA